MKAEIIQNIDNPRQLEKLYRKNKTTFQRVFNTIYPVIKENSAAQIWNERLNYPQEEIFWGQKNDLIFVAVVIFIAGLIAQIPQFFSIDEDFFFPRNIGFIVFPMLTAYFAYKQNLGINKLLFPIIAILLSVFYINFLPDNDKSDSIILACIHLPIFLWTVVGYTFVGGNLNAIQKKIDFLRYNGDFVVMTAVMVLSGILFTGITIGLFELIGLKIEDFFAQHIAVWGAPAIPILATYLVQNNPQLVNKISPVIARIFTPIVFVTLLIFLIAIIYTGKNLYNDRNFLLIFNALLIGVMAIILFSVTAATKNANEKLNLLFLFGLSALTIILNGLALSAIAFRLVEFGITPNRIAVLGANLLIFINLILVAHKLFLILKGKSEVHKVENVIAFFIPIYGIWTALVTFLFPILFNFK
ncbi:MAG: hypothetical protein A3F91_08670 [Flavobacteria bacterium RIFCSPLOWO2_12_FULL_35_11]|nr:MAG: hypothetical protein A3F91_08670 [Flavobacteria bacterium RIFCSPLOWO2_12_FULL_35_11]